MSVKYERVRDCRNSVRVGETLLVKRLTCNFRVEGNLRKRCGDNRLRKILLTLTRFLIRAYLTGHFDPIELLLILAFFLRQCKVHILTLRDVIIN